MYGTTGSGCNQIRTYVMGVKIKQEKLLSIISNDY